MNPHLILKLEGTLWSKKVSENFCMAYNEGKKKKTQDHLLQISESYQIAEGTDTVVSETRLVSVGTEHYKREWEELITQDDQQWEKDVPFSTLHY